MKKKYNNRAEQQDAYRERVIEKQAVAAESKSEREQCAKFDLRFFGESAFEHNAQTCQEEISIHRQFLAALGEPDIQQETLRELAKRTWDALLLYKFTSVDGDTAWIPMFNPNNQTFDGGPSYEQGGQGYVVRGLRGYFEEYWHPPKDCSGDEIILIDTLPKLPPIKSKAVLK
jgi:hypothetical protein